MPHPALKEGDSAAILDLIESLTAAETLDEYARMAMIGLRDLIPCIDSSYNEMNPSAGRIRWAAEPENSRMGEFAPNPLVFRKTQTVSPGGMSLDQSVLTWL